jgi:hypothetical protein
MAADFLKRSREPAPVDPGPGAAARPPGFFERRRRRARLREQLAVREEMLLELGALVFELHRQGQRAPELLQARAAELDAVDAEVRAMQQSLAAGDSSAWPTEHAPAWTGAGDWDAVAEHTGEWDAIADQTGEWDAAAQPTGDWDGPEGEWDETGEWVATDESAEWSESGEWVEGEDPGATQEWSVDEALHADDITADPHDPAAEDALPGDAAPEAPAGGHAAAPDDPPAEEGR